MRISARAILPSTLLFFLSVVLLAPEAVAGGITVGFSGTVQGTNSTFPANVMLSDVISNSSFAYNTAQTPSDNQTNGKYIFTGTGQTFALFVNTPVPNGIYNSPSWGDDRLAGGSFEIDMSKSGSTTTMKVLIATVGGTAQNKSGAGVTLTFTSTTYTGGLALPTTSAQMTNFLLTKGSLVWDPGGPGALGSLSFFSNDIGDYVLNGQSVPEPSSLVLAVMAMAVTSGGYLIRRRKAVGASQSG